MVITVKAFAKAKKNAVNLLDQKNLRVYVTSPPERDKANKHVVDLLSRHYGVAKNKIEIIRGHHSQNKTIKVSL